MRSPLGLEVIESCLGCTLRADRLFCDLPESALRDFDAIKYPAVFPRGAMLFVEGQSPRGIFVLCTGTAKLSTCSSDGKTLITQVAEPGELLGLSATVSGKPYEATVETLEHCQVNFVKREDFMKFLSAHGDACLKVAQHLSNNYHQAYEQVRSLGLSHSAAEKLAKLLLEWSTKAGEETAQGVRLKMALTHEEIAQMIGTSRETVTRLFGDFKSKQIIRLKGSTLFIRNKESLEAMVR
jgi:CRP/FNR family transcriptional regulator